MAQEIDGLEMAYTNSGLPVLHASVFSVGGSVQDIAVSLGHMKFRPDGDGLDQFTEWFATVKFSPTTAKQLAIILAGTLKRYEDQFGTIPTDPKAKITEKVLGARGKLPAPMRKKAAKARKKV